MPICLIPIAYKNLSRETFFDCSIEYFKFDVRNKEIADLFNIQYQTTLLIFKNNKEVYRSIGETSREAIYKAIKSSI